MVRQFCVLRGFGVVTVYNLTDYASIQTAMFCRLDIPDYEVLRFSNFSRPFTIDGESYSALGTLLSVSDTQDELRVVAASATVSISGIPNTRIAEFLDYEVKGSSIQMWRVLFNTVSGQPLAITGNPQGRFQGIVNNVGIEEDLDFAAQQATSTITLTCSSVQELMTNKVAGRRTNPRDMDLYFPSDTSFDRVPNLARSNLNWGAP